MTQSISSASNVQTPALEPKTCPKTNKYFRFDATSAFYDKMVARECTCSSTAAKIFFFTLPVLLILETVFEIFKPSFDLLKAPFKPSIASKGVKPAPLPELDAPQKPSQATVVALPAQVEKIVEKENPAPKIPIESAPPVQTEEMLVAELQQKILVQKALADKKLKSTPGNALKQVFKKPSFSVNISDSTKK